ncbi:ParB/RepB/Spo0J family partition protein [Arcanobacterium hippocoleae]|uniref:ParB family chromosome partitioning protein n=1 Tax=Arcanobacterium hippocoleae TaxID=149017 RepID=A0ABU1T2G5_9ACTO|nr:ParB/RepB/Spo0J family partition protein [Arcanobacterium hippocoleae]MDR6939582.1 ParB family chromosome partitioning protein [Arcanobacterium hippocoleae]
MAERRRGLGRGIGALIPESQRESKNSPIDVFFTKPNLKSNSEAERTDIAASFIADQPINNQNKKERKQKSSKNRVKEQRSVTTQKINETADSGNAISNHAQKKAKVYERSKAQDTVNDENELVPVPGVTFGEIPVFEIVPNTKQPRQIFDEEDLDELAASIKEVGVLQPIVVRPLNEKIKDNPSARYELIMGERRWRASQLAGKDTVPAIVRRTEDEDLLRDALLENLHRAQLNALEEAAAYQQLLEDFQCTQEELSRRIARSRPQISNTLRLLKLPALVQRRVASGVLSAGHARALLALPDAAAMERIAQRIVAEGLSVRATEEIVALGENIEMKPSRQNRSYTQAPELSELATRLGERFETRVKVSLGLRKGKITIDFASTEDLNRILAAINEKPI